MSRQLIALLYGVIFVGLLFGLHIKNQQMKELRKEVGKINKCLDFAATSALETMRKEYGTDGVLYSTCDEFFRAYELQANDDISDLKLFVPAMIYCDTKGYSVGSLDAGGVFMWTENKPYSLDMGDFTLAFGLDNSFYVTSGIYSASCTYDSFFGEGEKRDYELTANNMAADIFRAYDFEMTKERFFELKSDAIILSVQDTVTESVNEHNAIAESLGMDYIYSVPTFYSVDQEYPSFIVCFQGYPLKANGKFYNSLYARSGYIGRKSE